MNVGSWARRAACWVVALAMVVPGSAAHAAARSKPPRFRLGPVTVNPDLESPSDAVTKAMTATFRSLGAPRYFTRGLFSSDIETAPGYFAEPAGDLDGDGKKDLLGIRYERSDGNLTMTIAGIRGVDGEVLWTRDLDDAYAWPIPTRVGPDGDPGVLLVAFLWDGVDVLVAGVSTYSLSLESISGSGDSLWQESFDGYAADSWFSSHALDIPMTVGFLNGVEGDATDLMMERVLYRYDPAGEDERKTLDVIDGRDGSVAYSAGSLLDDTYYYEIPTPDLSGDGLDDYLEVRPEGRRQNHVTARQAFDGEAIWEQDMTGRFGDMTFGVGDTDGDDVSDLILTSACNCVFILVDGGASASSSRPYFPGGGGATTLLSGKTGEQMWKKTGDPIRLGDVNGDGLADIGLQDADFRAPSATYSAVTGSGDRLYSEHYSIKHPGGSSGHVDFVSNMGDIDGDGIRDSMHRFEFADFKNRHFYIERGVVSGADGKKLWDGNHSRPLHASVDGIGDDLVKARKSNGTFSISIEDGRDGTELWRTEIPTGKSRAFVGAMDLTGDGRAEVLVDRFGSIRRGDFGVIVLDPTDGHIVWQLGSNLQEVGPAA